MTEGADAEPLRDESRSPSFCWKSGPNESPLRHQIPTHRRMSDAVTTKDPFLGFETPCANSGTKSTRMKVWSR